MNFTAIVRVVHQGSDMRAEGQGRTSKNARQQAVLRLLHVLAGFSADNMPLVPPTTTIAAPIVTRASLPEDPTSALNQLVVCRRMTAPEFDIVSAGPPHSPTFTCKMMFDGETYEARGPNKQMAKKEACRLALAAWFSKQ